MHIKTIINARIFVALLESLTEALNNKQKIINGSSMIITSFMLKLSEYKNCLSTNGIILLKNKTAHMAANKIKGILRNIRLDN